MKFRSKLAAITVTMLSCSGLLLAGGAPASAADTVAMTFCNDRRSEFDYHITFSQRPSSTFIVFPGECVPSWVLVSPGEPYVTGALGVDGQYRNTAAYTVSNCNEKVTLFITNKAADKKETCV